MLQIFKLWAPRNATKARDVLIGKDIIERTIGGFAFLDPGFEMWFKREFLGKSVVLDLRSEKPA